MPTLIRPEGALPQDFHVTRRAAGGLRIAGYALGAGKVSADPIHTDTEGLVALEVRVPEAGYQMPAYLAFPAGARHRPVVVVVSEIFGLHEYIRDLCRRLAKAGYVAIAPDFYARVGDPAPEANFDEIRKIVATATHAQVMGDIHASLDWLASNPDVGQGHGALGGLARFADVERAGITGFCWGGSTVWMALADDPRFKAGVAWYGRLAPPKPGEFLGDEKRPWPLDIASQLHGPVLGLYAGKDQGITAESIEKMKAALAAAGDRRSQIIVYPDANHGFHADYREKTYNKVDAEDGWKRLLAWFGKYLKG
jgi:carboxymethylenebutenolidase